MASLPSMSIEAQLLTAALHEERDTSNEMNCISSVTNAKEEADYEKNAITMNDTVTQQQRTDIGMRDARANLESQCPAMKALLIAPLDCVASIPANTFRACKENVATPESPVARAEEAPGVHQLVSDSPVSSFISRSTEGSAEIPGDQVSSGNPFHEALDKRDKLQMCDKVLGEKDQNSFRSFKAKSTIPFGDANFDCFQTRSVTVRGSERILIHHWTAIFGEMMFGILHSSINPMAEVWIPDAFSNEASFQGMLAYAAAHMAHLRRQGGGTEYTIYKIEAIRCIQKLLNDATAALSDSAVSAILRQISIEDRFGSPTVADLHRTGLFNIIEKKGGLMSLRKSWRLEFLLYWYLITSRPKFYLQDVRHQDLSDDSLNNSGCKDALRLSHSKLLLDRFAEVFSFLHDLKVLTQEGSDRGIPVLPIGMDPANSLLRLFKSAVDSSRGLTHEIVGETCRLASLFYITSVKADSLRLGTNDMEVLSNTLSETQLAWEYSSETLLWVVLRGKGPGLENPRRAQMVQSLMEVAKSLPEHSWSVLKKLLIAFLWGDAQDVVSMYEELLLLVRGMIGNIT